MLVAFVTRFIGLGIVVTFWWFVPYAAEVFIAISSAVVILWMSGPVGMVIRKIFCRRKVDTQDKAILITGCDTGFGHLLAKRLDNLGFTVFAGCLFPDGTGATELRHGSSNRLHILELDVSKDDNIKEAVRYVNENLDGKCLWALVNNAGIAQAGELEWTSMEELQRIFEVNTFGTLKITKSFLSLIRQAKGRVICVSGVAGSMPCPGFVGYCMTKSAVISFVEGFRLEMEKWGVKSINVEPWFYKTGITSEQGCCDIIEKTWNKAPMDVQDAYGVQYLDAFKKCAVRLLARSNGNVGDVINSLEDAVVNKEPQDQYNPCDLITRIFLFIVGLLPPGVLHIAQRLHLPFVKPNALTLPAEDPETNLQTLKEVSCG